MSTSWHEDADDTLEWLDYASRRAWAVVRDTAALLVQEIRLWCRG